nr:MAG TPA: hypothetical protein [Caudoviricetes sp.]
MTRKRFAPKARSLAADRLSYSRDRLSSYFLIV